MERAVLIAARETAQSLISNPAVMDKTRLLFRSCMHAKPDDILLICNSDPTYVSCRASGLLNIAVDGMTPLHCAARWGKVECVHVLLKEFRLNREDNLESVHVSSDPWAVDLQGRTPLHHASEWGHLDVCRILRQYMQERAPMYLEIEDNMSIEQSFDPVGVNAPVDLTGRTPLGWANTNSKPKIFPSSFENSTPRKAVPIKSANSLELELFSPGDASILPKTPCLLRTGLLNYKKEKTDQPTTTQDGLLYAFSEATGWTSSMEDKIIVHCPVLNSKSPIAKLSIPTTYPHVDLNITEWSIFAVFDGHGGNFSSNFVSSLLPNIIVDVAIETINAISDEVSDADVFAILIAIIKRSFIKADEVLSRQNRMQIKVNKAGNFILDDFSGSTCSLCLLTHSSILVSNAGDSRSVLGRRGNDDGFEVIPMSFDHKPNNAEERERVNNAGLRFVIII